MDSHRKNEIEWYMDEVISNSVDSIKETLQSCVNNLDEDNTNSYKLPLSSHKTEMIKGTITRENFKITGLHLLITSKNFSNGKKFELRLKPDSYILIRQLLDCHDAMENAIGNLNKIVENHKNGNDVDLFIKYIDQAYSHIQLALKSLSDPDPAYVFPKYRVPTNVFDPPFPSTGALDFSVNDGELTVEFKNLMPVDKRPWNVIVDKQCHLSFADIVRHQISIQRNTPMNKIIADEYNKYIEWRKNCPQDENEHETGLGISIKHLFASNSDPSISTLIKNASLYLEQSITYVNNENSPVVVQIVDKCEVITSDPVLLSISIKLESLEKNIQRIQENINNIYVP